MVKPKAQEHAGISAAAEIKVDRQAEVPLGVQLAWALRSRIGDGRLRAGERLPALRELAESAGVNLNTVRSVYQRLEHEGLIRTQQGSGTFVAAATDPRAPAVEIAARAARAAFEQGVSPREVAASLYVSDAPRPRSGDWETERREALRGEIRCLERVMGALQAANPGVRPPATSTRRRRAPGPSVLSAAQLEGVRAELVTKLTTLQREIDARTQGEDSSSPGVPVQSAAGALPAEAARKPAQRRTRSSQSRPATA